VWFLFPFWGLGYEALLACCERGGIEFKASIQPQLFDDKSIRSTCKPDSDSLAIGWLPDR